MNKRIRKVISAAKGRACLFTAKSDIFYLTGIELEGFWLLVTAKGAAAFASKMLSGQLKRLTRGIEIVSGDDITALLAGYCRNKGIKELGLCGAKSSYALFVKINCKIKAKDIGDILAPLRQVKDAGEIKAVKKACAIAAGAARYAIRIARPGMTEEEIVFKIEEYFAKKMVRPSFPIIVASGPNSANPHHISSKRKIVANDIILMDLGCVCKGYCSDLTRTFFLGKTNNLQQKVYALVKRAYGRAMGALKHGVPASSIDRAAREVISKAGFADKFIHTTGHGVGIDIHEPPRLSAKDNTVLKNGMIVTVEPGVYIEGRFGVRIEDTVLINKKGIKVLTQ